MHRGNPHISGEVLPEKCRDPRCTGETAIPSSSAQHEIRRSTGETRIRPTKRHPPSTDSWLTWWTKGAAVSVLTGAKAVAEREQAAQEAHCEHLRTNTVDEILAMYDELCPSASLRRSRRTTAATTGTTTRTRVTNPQRPRHAVA